MQSAHVWHNLKSGGCMWDHQCPNSLDVTLRITLNVCVDSDMTSMGCVPYSYLAKSSYHTYQSLTPSPIGISILATLYFFFAACRLTLPLSLEKITHRWFPTTVSRHHQLTGRNISDFTLLVWKLLSLYCIKIIKYFLKTFYSRWLYINSKKK